MVKYGIIKLPFNGNILFGGYVLAMSDDEPRAHAIADNWMARFPLTVCEVHPIKDDACMGDDFVQVAIIPDSIEEQIDPVEEVLGWMVRYNAAHALTQEE
jgi:hypothetical protein